MALPRNCQLLSTLSRVQLRVSPAGWQAYHAYKLNATRTWRALLQYPHFHRLLSTLPTLPRPLASLPLFVRMQPLVVSAEFLDGGRLAAFLAFRASFFRLPLHRLRQVVAVAALMPLVLLPLLSNSAQQAAASRNAMQQGELDTLLSLRGTTAALAALLLLPAALSVVDGRRRVAKACQCLRVVSWLLADAGSLCASKLGLPVADLQGGNFLHYAALAHRFLQRGAQMELRHVMRLAASSLLLSVALAMLQVAVGMDDSARRALLLLQLLTAASALYLLRQSLKFNKLLRALRSAIAESGFRCSSRARLAAAAAERSSVVAVSHLEYVRQQRRLAAELRRMLLHDDLQLDALPARVLGSTVSPQCIWMATLVLSLAAAVVMSLLQ
eukprot:PLAT3553.23.p1 GENE.PLAT3553.23~~PLAT3553.23.p1  ORF type:complete len:405 (+),score=111.90 PLAT3553.23:61-1215(+)